MPGYKMTEVGVIPEDWKDASLGELAEIRMCKRIFSEQTNPTGDIPFFKIGTFGRAPDAFISGNLYREYKRKYFFPKKGDVLLSAAGTLGKTVIYDGEDAYFQDSNIVWLDIDRTKIKNEYLYQCYQAIKWASPEGSTISRLYNGIIRKTKIPLPPTETEQRAIAQALSDVDALLATLDQVIAKKRDLKQATMQQLLTGKTRLPGFSGEWEVKRLGEVIERIVGGGTPSRANNDYWNGSTPWVTVKDFSTFNTQQTQEYITDAGLKNSASNLVPAGTLITSTRMALGKAVIYHVDVTINQDLKALFLKPNQDVQFMRYWFEQNSTMIDSIGGGSTVKGISIQQLQAFEFNSPPTKEEQTAIACVLSNMDTELSALEARRDKTRNIKQAMMQELLTGKTRLV